MADLRNLEQHCELLFSKLGALQHQLRIIPNARTVSSVENGLEYCVNVLISEKLVSAAQQDLRQGTSKAAERIAALERIIATCLEHLSTCEEIGKEAVSNHTWTENSEKRMISSWRLFCTSILDASDQLPTAELDFMLLIGKPERSTVQLKIPINDAVC